MEPQRRAVLDVPTMSRFAMDFFRQGRRTISFHDLVGAYERHFDATFTNRVVDLLPDVADALNAQGIHCTCVNEFCLRYFMESPVTTIDEARRCNMYNSGGKPAVGIRLALPDDLVRSEVPHSHTKLGMGNVEHAVKDSATLKAIGIATIESHQRLVQTIKQEFPRLLTITAEPQQGALRMDDDDLLVGRLEPEPPNQPPSSDDAPRAMDPDVPGPTQEDDQ